MTDISEIAYYAGKQLGLYAAMVAERKPPPRIAGIEQASPDAPFAMVMFDDLAPALERFQRKDVAVSVLCTPPQETPQLQVLLSLAHPERDYELACVLPLATDDATLRIGEPVIGGAADDALARQFVRNLMFGLRERAAA